MKSKLQIVKKRAKEKKLMFDLDKRWMLEKLNEKNCDLSNIPFDHDKGVWYTHSIDRVNNNGGYTIDNCKVILWGLNAGKGQNCSYDELYTISKAFVDNFGKVEK